MAQTNPLRTLVSLLRAVKRGVILDENGNVTAEKSSTLNGRGAFGSSLDLHDVGGLDTLEALHSLQEVLLWAERNSVRLDKEAKRIKLKRACDNIRTRLNWEFGYTRQTSSEPVLNYDQLIAELDLLADDLEDEPLAAVAEETLREWEETIRNLEDSIAGSELDAQTRDLFLDIVASLKTAVRRLRRFGTVACEEQLKNALGRIVTAAAVVPDSETKTSFLKRAGEMFVQMTEAVGTIQGFMTLAEKVRSALLP